MEIRGNIPGAGFAELTLRDGEIERVEVSGAEREGETFLAPGLIDVQLNGFAGVDFSDAALEPEQAVSVLPALWRTGTAAFCPTLITNSIEALRRNFRVLEAARRLDAGFAQAVPCYHLEGPYLSPGPSHGVHNPEYMHAPDWEEFCRLEEAAGGRIGIVTIAPELAGAGDFIQRAARAGVVVSVGHTDGGPEDVSAAVRAGATMATHLGNGCPQMLDRHSNPIWAQLAAEELTASIICDTFHLPPDLVRTVARMKGPARTVLVTDATHVAMQPPGRYRIVGAEIELLPSGKVVKVGDSCLAGSAVTMNRTVVIFQRFTGMTLGDALTAATTTPAKLLKRELCASLTPGQPGTLIAFRPGEDALTIEQLYLQGRRQL